MGRLCGSDCRRSMGWKGWANPERKTHPFNPFLQCFLRIPDHARQLSPLIKPQYQSAPLTLGLPLPVSLRPSVSSLVSVRLRASLPPCARSPSPYPSPWRPSQKVALSLQENLPAWQQRRAEEHHLARLAASPAAWRAAASALLQQAKQRPYSQPQRSQRRPFCCVYGGRAARGRRASPGLITD